LEKTATEERHNLYFSPSTIGMLKSRRMIWAGHVGSMRNRNACRILVGKPEGKRPVERPRHRWVGNVKWLFEKQDEILWTRLMWLKIGTS
jgi:hypothetical protein